jgi:hypothetical protein
MSVSVLTPFALPAGAPLPRFTHGAPRRVTLTVELVLHCRTAGVGSRTWIGRSSWSPFR